MAKSNQKRENGLLVYRLTVVEWQCHPTSLRSRFYVTQDVPVASSVKGRTALQVSYMYSSDRRESAEEYARAVASASMRNGRVRYELADPLYFDARVADAAEAEADWKDRWEAERQAHEATIAHCDAHHIDPRL